MFALFYSLYLAMFYGYWNSYDLTGITSAIEPVTQKLTSFLTNIFNSTTTNLPLKFSSSEVLSMTAFVLALITSIGIVVMAVKGVKKAFGIFFMGIR